jgi:exopolysaccharide biosynthesis polyprenyl glycosylphosphotransferase
MLPQALTAKPGLLAAENPGHGRHAAGPLLLASLVGDILVVFGALALASWLRFDTPLARLGVAGNSVRWTAYLGRAACGTLLFGLLLPHRRMYEVYTLLRPRQGALLIARTAAIWLLVFMALSWLWRSDPPVSRVYLLVAVTSAAGLMVAWRAALAAFARHGPVAQRLRQRILFAGWSAPARALAEAIAADRRHLSEIVGHVAPEEAAAALERGEADILILAVPNLREADTMALARACEKAMVEFKVIPTGFEILLSCLRLQTVSGVPVLGVSQLPLDSPGSVLAKQAVDLVGGLAGLILAAPVIALFGLLVYTEDRGPIIYRQRRLGRDGRPFWMYKVRSMKVDAEKDGRVGWTVKDDPRRLRIGAFMRRWNIDELPQFWNVLRGEMSLVGPRPERPELIRIFREEIPHYNARHAIKPGLTGWAQVNGFRGDTDLSARVRCDLYYMENWSLLLDLQIMLLTLFRRKNAG